MNYTEYTAKVMLLGFEVGRGNKNAFNEVFGEKEKLVDEKIEHEQTEDAEKEEHLEEN